MQVDHIRPSRNATVKHRSSLINQLSQCYSGKYLSVYLGDDTGFDYRRGRASLWSARYHQGYTPLRYLDCFLSSVINELQRALDKRCNNRNYRIFSEFFFTAGNDMHHIHQVIELIEVGKSRHYMLGCIVQRYEEFIHVLVTIINIIILNVHTPQEPVPGIKVLA